MSTWDWAQSLFKLYNSKDKVIEELVKKIDADRQMDNLLFNSRFFEVRQERDDNGNRTGRKFLVKVTERYISDSYDLEDCGDGEKLEFLYMEDDATLHPVTVGRMTRQDMAEHEVIYGSAALIANGKQVGYITYTDH